MHKSFEHLKPLSKISTGAGIPFLTPDVSPGIHCPMKIATHIAQTLRGLSSLLIGMPECTTHARLFQTQPQSKDKSLHWLYVLDAREVVFGFREGISDALYQMDQEGIRHLLLIGTCIPDLIGEDLKGLIEEIGPTLSMQISFVLLGQFKNISYPTGSWKTLASFEAFMEPRPENKKMINILGRSPHETEIPASSLFSFLERKGFCLRYLGPEAHIEDFVQAPDATLNLVISPYGAPLAEKMAQRFHIPQVPLHQYYDLGQIDDAYKAIGDRLGQSLQEAFVAERATALTLESKIKPLVKELGYVLLLRIDLPLPLSLYLSGTLNMHPLLLHLEEFYPEDKAHVEALLHLGWDPMICRIVNEFRSFSEIEALHPDMCLGYLPHSKSDTPWVEDMLDFYGQVGYERTAQLLSRMGASLENKLHLQKGNENESSSI